MFKAYFSFYGRLYSKCYTIILVISFTILVIISCKKYQNYTSTDTGSLKNIHDLEKVFNDENFQKSLINNYMDSIHIVWKPNWEKFRIINSNTTEYFYVPLNGLLTTNKHPKAKQITTFNTEKYLIISVTKKDTTFNLATYSVNLEKSIIGDVIESKYKDHSIPFNFFSGVVTIQNLKTGNSSFYTYVDGSLSVEQDSKKLLSTGKISTTREVCRYYLECIWINNFPTYCGNFSYGVTQTPVNNVNTVEECYQPPGGYWSDGVNSCVPDWTFGGSQIIRGDCSYTPNEPPPLPPPSSSDPNNNPDDNGVIINPTDPYKFENLVVDTCLKNTVNEVLSNNIKGKISEIIKKLDRNVNITITFYDVENTVDNRPGATGNTHWLMQAGVVKSFTTDITLSKSHLLESSKEYAAAVIMHEILHAYFRQSTAQKEKFDGLDHETMAENYITPMAEFLSELYGIKLYDAYAIAWEGVQDTKAYKEADQLQLWSDKESVAHTSKSDASFVSTQYLTKIKGLPLCNPQLK